MPVLVQARAQRARVLRLQLDLLALVLAVLLLVAAGHVLAAADGFFDACGCYRKISLAHLVFFF